jgi:signal transduction histidine kinase
VTRSLVARTLLLVGGVVLVLGAAVALWIAAQDREDALRDAKAQQDAAEREFRELARDVLGVSQRVATRLVEAADRRLRQWIEEEPLSLYRSSEDPDAVDVEAIKRAITAEVRRRGRDEAEHVGLLTDRMAADTEARIDERAATLEQAANRRAEAASDDRRARLYARLALLLAGMAALLGATLYVLVIAPVRRLRAEVNRIASGDLAPPASVPEAGAAELAALTRDVERMREQIQRATTGLEAEVSRKTETLSRTLGERTHALEELERTKDRLVQTAKMAGLGTLAGGVAHEFNNLLGGILACLENARASTADPSVLDDLDVAKRTAERATSLVQALLGVARPGTRLFAPVHLESIVGDVWKAAAPAAERRRVRLERESRGDPVVNGDAGQLHQVVLNLLTNALQSVDDGEQVVVATRVEGAVGVLEVRDSGAGVPAADRDRIFEPFFTGREGGTGLGLFVSYGIVERHGGRIEVGDAPEGGARFTVRLPLAG